ncbi:hypothetical protein FRB94_005154 [Tulasnella sp. JGI-2019a]|nr:hypothetical protein FRB94_005154 [Tulasnella sp. JGI-2019a]KAG9017754.1 hypothetical protein FRB93_004565 [Tulasnella sp. JGI-2019a]
MSNESHNYTYNYTYVTEPETYDDDATTQEQDNSFDNGGYPAPLGSAWQFPQPDHQPTSSYSNQPSYTYPNLALSASQTPYDYAPRTNMQQPWPEQVPQHARQSTDKGFGQAFHRDAGALGKKAKQSWNTLQAVIRFTRPSTLPTNPQPGSSANSPGPRYSPTAPAFPMAHPAPPPPPPAVSVQIRPVQMYNGYPMNMPLYPQDGPY